MLRGETLQALHITDLHLRAAPDGEIYQVRTNESFRAVMTRALADRDWRPAVILVTGDIAEDPTAEVYERFRAEMERLGLPVLCLPGNHDDPAVMAKVLNRGHLSLCASQSVGRWRFISLDSFIRGEDGGRLSAAELQRLEGELVQARDQWVVAAVHHQPLPIGSAWLDAAGLVNGEELLALLARHDHARLVIHGHVHQASDRQLGHVRLLSTPSTCAQFAPNTQRCLMDVRPPGFRRLQLLPNGRIDTEIHWLEDWAPARRPVDSRAAVLHGGAQSTDS